MFRAFSRPSSRAQLLTWQPLVLPSYHGDSRAVFAVGPARPRTQHGGMGGRTPETCWAVNNSQDNKLGNCCIWLVIYFNWTERFVRRLLVAALRIEGQGLIGGRDRQCFVTASRTDLRPSYFLSSRYRELFASFDHLPLSSTKDKNAVIIWQR
jgi:hypothetical protein